MRLTQLISTLRCIAPGALPVVAALAAAGCAAVPATIASIEPDEPVSLLAEDAPACRTGAGTTISGSARSIDPASIELFNWNMQKGGDAGWTYDLQALADRADVLTLQEAPLVNAGWNDHSEHQYHAFAPGYRSMRTPTGVLTISDVQPLVQCNLTAREPLLRTSKATVITEYAVDGRAETLLVINIHAVNFTLGLGAFEAQMGEVGDVVNRHRGPVIFTGDFNTWRQSRIDLVDVLADTHGLVAVEFAEDERKRFLGRPLDHVYVRGLDVVSATTYEIETSDHNPMRVWLSIS